VPSIAEGETLFVERKQDIPTDGLAPTVASFANTLGGWVLLGVANDGTLTDYTWKGRADLQDHVREHLRGTVDPLPPFAAAAVMMDNKTVGVVRVAESADTPHIVAGHGRAVRARAGRKGTGHRPSDLVGYGAPRRRGDRPRGT
jgi:predicted HTH transcriptional regulator